MIFVSSLRLLAWNSYALTFPFSFFLSRCIRHIVPPSVGCEAPDRVWDTSEAGWTSCDTVLRSAMCHRSGSYDSIYSLSSKSLGSSEDRGSGLRASLRLNASLGSACAAASLVVTRNGPQVYLMVINHRATFTSTSFLAICDMSLATATYFPYNRIDRDL